MLKYSWSVPLPNLATVMFSHQVSEALGHNTRFLLKLLAISIVFLGIFSFGHLYQSTGMKLAVDTTLLTLHCTDSFLLVRIN